MPLTVGATAGPVVYPRSPPIIVPAAVLVYVLPKIPKVAAEPRDGVVAARVDTGPVRASIRVVTDMATLEALISIFRYLL